MKSTHPNPAGKNDRFNDRSIRKLGWAMCIVGTLALGHLAHKLIRGHMIWKARTPMCESVSAMNYKIKTADGTYIRAKPGKDFTYKDHRYSVLGHTKELDYSGGLHVREGDGHGVKPVPVVPLGRFNRWQHEQHVKGLAFEGWTCEKPEKSASSK